MIPAKSYASEPNLTLEHWQIVKSIQSPELPSDVWKLILNNFKILSLPTSKASVPVAIDFIRTLNSNQQHYLDYVLKYFNCGHFPPQALRKFDKGEYGYVIENAQAAKLANFLQYDESLRSEQRVVLAAIQKNDRSFAMGHGRLLYYISQELQNDRAIVLAAVQKFGTALRYVSPKLQSDREIVLAAVQQDGRALQFANQKLKEDREIVFAAVQKYGRSLQFASRELKGDLEIVFDAIQQDGWALEFASQQLRGNRHIVLAAVQENGDALQYASQELQNDPELQCIAGRL